ncbi:MAG: hypothetical protein M3450_20830 [Actinomycetota bacterium]|nr:hypothetical protein [Actinomycetota bacterium]
MIGTLPVDVVLGAEERLDASAAPQQAGGAMADRTRHHEGEAGRGTRVHDGDLARLRARITALEARCLSPADTVPEPDGAAHAEVPSRRERVTQPWRKDLMGLAALFVSTRVALVIIGQLSRDLVPGPVVHPQPLGTGSSYSSHEFLDLWGQWDTSWYLSIAEHGYTSEPLQGPFANYAFFPLYPLLARWVGWLVGGPFIGGLVVSNVALLVACVFVYRLAALDADAGTARRTVKYLFVAPGAFLFSAMLTESTFLALSVMCFYFARTKRWWAVGVLGFLLALSRPPSALVVIPLLWMYGKERDFSLRRAGPDVLWLALLPAGLCVFMAVNEVVTGDAMSFTRIQVTAWGHRLQNPITSLWQNLSSENSFWRFNAWYLLGVLALTVAFLRRLGGAYLLFALVVVLPPMSYGGWDSMVRYTLVIFPLYVVGARATAGRPHVDQAATIALALLQVFLMTQWANNGSLVI